MMAPLAAAALIAACGGAATPQPATSTGATIAVDLDLPVAQGSPNSAVLWLHPQDVSRSLLVAANGDAGLVLYGLDAAQQGTVGSGRSDFVAVAYGFDAGAGPGALLVAQDLPAGALRAWALDAGGKPRELTAAPLVVGEELTGLCLYRSSLSGRHYAFAATGAGELQQWELTTRGGAVQGRIVRTIPVGSGIGSCAVDAVAGSVYVADESVGIWRIAAEPEADPAQRQLVELTAPRGQLGEQVKGIAIHQADGARHLLAADEEAGVVRIFALPGGKYLGQFRPGGDQAAFESVAASAFAPAPWQAGFVLVPDGGGASAGYRLLKWEDIAAVLELPAAAPVDPRVVAAASARLVEPAVETEPVDDFGDAADDPAIWIHPADPARSLVIAAQKRRGIEVYDLTGKRLQVMPDGRTNNVDLRQGVRLGGSRRDIVAGSNRTTKTLTLYEVDATTRRLVDAAAAPIPTGLGDPYGLCMYHSANSGKLYVLINDPDKGEFRQWEITAEGTKLAATLVREFTVGSQAEGCAADDETGALYVAEEDVGLWRYGAEPDAGDARRKLDSTGTGGRLQADVEGIGIYRGRDGTGYLVVSNQGADNYAVYRRDGDNAFVGMFSIVANNELGIDGASETDGLEVTSTPLGNRFPQGLLVVQDGRNITPAGKQNFKLVPWERVAAALGL